MVEWKLAVTKKNEEIIDKKKKKSCETAITGLMEFLCLNIYNS